MPDKCVVFSVVITDQVNKTERISLYPIPFEGAKKKWVHLVKSKRARPPFLRPPRPGKGHSLSIAGRTFEYSKFCLVN